MRNKVIILSVLFCLSANVARPQVPTDLEHYALYPAYVDVVDYFYFQLSRPVQSNMLRFSKQPDGWHVAQIDPLNHNAIVNDWLLWSVTTQMFSSVPIPEALYVDGNNPQPDDWRERTVNLITTAYQSDYYDRMPVFGYDGFEADLDTIYAAQSELSTEQYYLWARAFSSICDKMMLRMPSVRYGDTFRAYLNAPDSVPLPKDGVLLFANAGERALALYDTVRQLDPTYLTVVGDIGLKHDNEYMARVLDWLLLGLPQRAMAMIETADLYDDFLLGYARNMLRTCGDDAILVVAGDQDTYTCLYSQLKDGFRADVTLVHSGLANLDYYISYLDKALPHTLPVRFYHDELNDYVLFEPSSGDTVELQRWMNDVQAAPQSMRQAAGIATLLAVPGSHAVMSIAPPHEAVSKDFGPTFVAEKEMAYLAKDYLMSQGHFFLLDVVFTNQWQRPVYFSMGTTPKDRLNWSGFLRWEGLVFQLIPQLGVDRNQARLTTELERYHLGKPQQAAHVQGLRPNIAFTHYLYLYYTAGRVLNAEVTRGRLKRLTERFLASFPIEESDYLDFSAFIAEFCYAVDKVAEGDAIVRKRAAQLEELLKDTTSRLYRNSVRERSFLVTVAHKSPTAGLGDEIERQLQD